MTWMVGCGRGRVGVGAWTWTRGGAWAWGRALRPYCPTRGPRRELMRPHANSSPSLHDFISP
jgi:hypothetical protein